jgi:hypothetical protein
VDVAAGSSSGSAVGAGGTTGDGTHAAKIRALSATNSSWQQQWTECKDLLIDRV